MLAAAAIVTAVVYLFTPLTAAGQEGEPTGFFTNTRYLLPGLLLAITLLPIARPLRAPENRARIVLIFLTVVYAITVLTSPRWYPGFLPGAVFLTLAIVWAPVGLTWLREHGKVPRSVIISSVAAIALIAAVWGRGEEVGYAKKHYTRSTLFLQEGGPAAGFRFHPRPHRQTDRDRRFRPDVLRAVRLLRDRPFQLRPVHRAGGRQRHLPPDRQAARTSSARSTRATTTSSSPASSPRTLRIRLTATRSAPGSRTIRMSKRWSPSPTSLPSPTTSTRSTAGSTRPTATRSRPPIPAAETGYLRFPCPRSSAG